MSLTLLSDDAATSISSQSARWGIEAPRMPLKFDLATQPPRVQDFLASDLVEFLLETLPVIHYLLVAYMNNIDSEDRKKFNKKKGIRKRNRHNKKYF